METTPTSAPAPTAPAAETQAPPAAEIKAPPADDGIMTEADLKKLKAKVKIYGKEAVKSMDEIIREYQMKEASQQKFEQAAMKEKQYQEFLREASDKPERFFEAFKKDPYQWAENLLIEKLKYEQASPDQKARYDAERRLQMLEAEKQLLEQEKLKREEELANRDKQGLLLKAGQEIEDEMVGAFQEAGIKANPRTIGLMAELMEAHLEATGGEKMTAKRALSIVHSQMLAEKQAYWSSIPPDQLVDVLPKEVLDGIRKHELQKVRSQSPLKRPDSVQPTLKKTAKGSVKGSTDEVFKRLEKKFGR